MECPCGVGQQIERVVKHGPRRGSRFWGCSTFPNCRITYSKLPEVVLPTFTPSIYQLKAADLFYSGHNVVVNATAGAGKSATIKYMVRADKRPGRVLVLVFNALPRHELREALPGTDVHTFNSFGAYILRQHGYNAQINDNRFWTFFESRLVEPNATWREKSAVGYKIQHLLEILTILKESLITPADFSRDTFLDIVLANRIAVQDGDFDNYFFWLHEALNDTITQTKEMTFLDQIYLPLIWGLTSRVTYDRIYVDEFQDTNPANQALLLAHSGPEAQLFVVGDANQSIYMWRRADPTAMSKAVEDFGAVATSLPLTYRNAKAIVRYVNIEFPYIDHQALPTAPTGLVRKVDRVNDIIPELKAGDMIVARRNLPLLELAWQLVELGYKNVRFGGGQDDSWRIEKVLGKVLNVASNATAKALVNKNITEQIKLARDTGRSTHYIDQLYDTKALVFLLLDKTESPKAALKFVRQMYSKVLDKSAIMLYTVHGAKGLQAPRVYVLESSKLLWPKDVPHARNEPEVKEALNITFVAITRPELELVLVRE